MAETPRIRWAEIEHGSVAGYVGILDGPVFKLQGPVLAGQRCVLTAKLPGWLDEIAGGTVDELKAEAERWLEEFVSSLGAIFPAQSPEMAAVQAVKE